MRNTDITRISLAPPAFLLPEDAAEVLGCDRLKLKELFDDGLTTACHLSLAYDGSPWCPQRGVRVTYEICGTGSVTKRTMYTSLRSIPKALRELAMCEKARPYATWVCHAVTAPCEVSVGSFGGNPTSILLQPDGPDGIAWEMLRRSIAKDSISADDAEQLDIAGDSVMVRGTEGGRNDIYKMESSK